MIHLYRTSKRNETVVIVPQLTYGKCYVHRAALSLVAIATPSLMPHFVLIASLAVSLLAPFLKTSFLFLSFIPSSNGSKLKAQRLITECRCTLLLSLEITANYMLNRQLTFSPN